MFLLLTHNFLTIKSSKFQLHRCYSDNLHLYTISISLNHILLKLLLYTQSKNSKEKSDIIQNCSKILILTKTVPKLLYQRKFFQYPATKNGQKKLCQPFINNFLYQTIPKLIFTWLARLILFFNGITQWSNLSYTEMLRTNSILQVPILKRMSIVK